MRKANVIVAALTAVGLSLAAQAYANDIWQFTVTRDQNGPDSPCYEPGPIPCTITSRPSPYILADLTISAPMAVFSSYTKTVNGPMIIYFDDKHVIDFKFSSSLGLSPLDFPVTPTDPYDATISVNETGTSLSGFITASVNDHGTPMLLMTGMDNLWTGYWWIWDGPVHQFWARTDKVTTIAVK